MKTRSISDQEPEALSAHRIEVRDWLKQASGAVESFHRDSHSFWRDSRQPKEAEAETHSVVTTSRSYWALLAADRCLHEGRRQPPEWVGWFKKYVSTTPLKIDTGKVHASGEKDALNNFEVAHLADLETTAQYIQRFYPKEGQELRLLIPDGAESLSLKDCAAKHLQELLLENAAALRGEDGAPLVGGVGGNQASRHHYFVTLHGLRALAMINESVDRGRLQHLVTDAQTFCIKQCFYFQRPIRHERDVFRLAFAGAVYALYEQDADRDLCLAIVQSIAGAQQEDGRWPTTHPIDRPRLGPWHITSHEIALCLTWLYFQPQLPDEARVLLLDAMKLYFDCAVARSFVRIPYPKKSGSFLTGWYDDHTRRGDFVVGWVNAIVCHFLANYHAALSDHINRRVIESLNLQAVSRRFCVDRNSHYRSPKWSIDRKDHVHSPQWSIETEEPLATWPDLPPFAWSRHEPATNDVADTIQWLWTDPSLRASISAKLASGVIGPIFGSPAGRPWPDLCSGMLPGDPGTRKTSLVKAMAEILEWPLVQVPASAIFEKSFDHMETRATEVFRRLNYLRGCVIFFDEFEEFFKSRRVTHDEQGSEERNLEGKSEKLDNLPTKVEILGPSPNRTIAAFTTSAMLARLQELHDEGYCLIFFATNEESSVDPAIKRPGRFDFKINVRHPERERWLEYLDRPTKRTFESLGFHIENRQRCIAEKDQQRYKMIADAVTNAAMAGEDGGGWKFRYLESALRAVSQQRDGASDDALVECARRAINKERELSRSEPPSLDELFDG